MLACRFSSYQCSFDNFAWFQKIEQHSNYPEISLSGSIIVNDLIVSNLCWFYTFLIEDISLLSPHTIPQTLWHNIIEARVAVETT
jgi:hypothetical protein